MRTIAILAMALLLGLSAAEPAAAQPVGQGAGPEPLAQKQTRRARTKLRVHPLYPYRRTHTFYPPPYDIVYPGPNAKRQCVDGYVTEHRPSGTVITPRMRCWWVPG